MSIQLSDLLNKCESLWPLDGAEEWDAPGLVTGNRTQSVSRVLLTVDVTNEIINEAVDGEFDVVIAHHPFLLRSVNTVAEHAPKGLALSKAIRSNLAIYAAHTNADIVENGVSDVLAKSLGLIESKPLLGEVIGTGRVGNLPSEIKLGDFARLIAKVLPSTATGIRVAGDYEKSISRVAVCGGAGDSFIDAAIDSGADVYVTSDLRHHLTQEAREKIGPEGMALVDVSHWASEWLWLEVAAEQLENLFPSVQFVVSQLRTDPWDFVVTQ